jgi:hypothetical protein
MAHLIQTLGKLRELEGACPPAKGHSSLLLQDSKALVADVLAELDRLVVCAERWSPVLESFSELKAEVREPIILLLRDCQRIEDSLRDDASTKRPKDLASELKSLVRSDPAVRRALALEQQIEVLLTLLNKDLDPFAEFATAVVAEVKNDGVELKVSQRDTIMGELPIDAKFVVCVSA